MIRQCHTVCLLRTHLTIWLNACVTDESYVSEFSAVEGLHVMQFEKPKLLLRAIDNSYCDLLMQSSILTPGVTKTSASTTVHALWLVFQGCTLM